MHFKIQDALARRYQLYGDRPSEKELNIAQIFIDNAYYVDSISFLDEGLWAIWKTEDYEFSFRYFYDDEDQHCFISTFAKNGMLRIVDQSIYDLKTGVERLREKLEKKV